MKYTKFFFSLSTSRLQTLALELASLFPSPNKTLEESAKLFFYGYQKSQNGNQAVNAGGPLMDKYHSIRKVLLKHDIINKFQISLDYGMGEVTFVNCYLILVFK